MKIRIKKIEHERVEDAPFVGALICANDCNLNCAGCFHQYLKSEPTKEIESFDLIKEVKDNLFNKGIIFAGLEWTLQPDELRELINLALENKLEVILYTGLTEEEFQADFSDLLTLPIYIKFGRYVQELNSGLDEKNGVLLASINQKIVDLRT